MSIAQRVTDNPVAIPRPSITAPFTRIDTSGEALTTPGGFGTRLRACRTAALDFRSEFAATGHPDPARTHDLISLPYPTRYGLFRAAISPTPSVTISNRMLIVRWTETDGTLRTMLFERIEHELHSYTEDFAELERTTPREDSSPVLTRTHSCADSLPPRGRRSCRGRLPRLRPPTHPGGETLGRNDPAATRHRPGQFGGRGIPQRQATGPTQRTRSHG